MWIKIWDTGIGIAKSDHNLIFDEFYQINNPPERDQQQGLGLGLAIVRKQAQLLNHDISMCSRLAQGSRFRLKLKKASPATISAHNQVALTNRFAPKNILVIDDDESILEGMRLTPEAWQCIVVTASDRIMRSHYSRYYYRFQAARKRKWY